jgi:uncharacterized repeat protein (TIGR02543 family)
LTHAVGSGNLAVGDLDRDGKLDLVLADYNHASATVLLGLGDGTFAASARFATAVGTGDIELDDFNRDGRLDVITSNVDSDSISILLNTAPCASPPAEGLVAWWRGEDNAVDSIGGNHGMLQGGATFADGVKGRSFQFDGAAAYVSGNASRLPSGNSARTIAAWIKTGSTSNQSILHYGGSDGSLPPNNFHAFVGNDGGLGKAGIGNGWGYGTVVGTSNVSDDQWHFIAGIYEGPGTNVVRIYVDGHEQANATVIEPDTAASAFEIGRFLNGAGGGLFNGQVDELAFYGRALSASEIAALSGTVPNAFAFAERTGMPRSTAVVSDPIFAEGITAPVPISVTGGEYQVNGGGWTSAAGTVDPEDEVEVRLTTSASYETAVAATLTIGGVSGAFTATTAAADDPDADGLVAWWKAEDNALDSVGGHHGTLQDGASFTAGREGQAFSFDATDDNVKVPHASAFDVGSSHSAELWVKLNELPAETTVIFNKWVSGVEDKLLVITDDGSIAYSLYNGFDGGGLLANTPLTIGVWHHIAVTYDGATARIYIDGNLDASKSASGVVNNGAGDLYLGFNPIRNAVESFYSSLNGAIDEFKWFNRALSPGEVGELSGVVPDAFAFTDQTGVMPHLLTASEPITVTGIRYPASISIADGEYEINDSGTWLSAPGTVAAGDTVRVHLMSSATYGATVDATLAIGGISDTFSVTTIEQHAVIFQTDGTPGATVNGAAVVTQAVVDGEDCTGVLAAAPDGYDFLGWTGGYTGTDNPLTLTNVTAGLTVTANFAMQQVAVGSVIVLDAADVVGIDLFRQQPKAHALHDLNGKLGSKASAKVLDKIDKVNGTATVRCEWTKKLRLYDVKAFKAAEKGGIGAAEWITPATMRDLLMELHVVSKEAVPTDQDIQPLALAVPVIDDVRIGEPDAKGNPTIMIVGQWFGTKKPKIWREYTVPGKVEGAVIIKRQTLKGVKPTELNTEYRDSKGKPACMDPLTGESQVIVIVPADPKGALNGTVVLENGVGMASGQEP